MLSTRSTISSSAAAAALWLSSASSVLAQTADATPAPAQNLPVFFLVAFLCLFGYLIYHNHTLAARLDALDRASAQDDAGTAPQPLGFDELVDSGGAMTLFGGSARIDRSGLYLLSTDDEKRLTTVVATVMRDVLAARAGSVLYVSQRAGADEIAAALMALEAGVPWESLSQSDQARRRRGLRTDLERYESGVHAFDALDWTPDGLFSGARRLKEEGRPVSALLVDDPGLSLLHEARRVETVERLRLLSVKCAVPVFVMSSGKGGELLMGIPSAEALFRAMMVVDAGEGRSTDCVARAVEPTAARPAVQASRDVTAETLAARS